jgi:allantoin racemase
LEKSSPSAARRCRFISRGILCDTPRKRAEKPCTLNIVNPNTTAAMTATIAAAAKKAARPDTVIRAVSSAFGPASIEGAYDDAFAVPGLLERIREGEAAGATRMSSPASTTPGSMRRVALASAPVVGIGEAGFHAATLLSHRFAVVTTLSRSVPVLENNLLRYGLDRRCARVRATDVAVLELDNPASNARAQESAPRSRARSRRITPRRSCSAAPAWRISRPRSRLSSACR